MVKTRFSGEVFKDNFTDLFYTDFEQTAFSFPVGTLFCRGGIATNTNQSAQIGVSITQLDTKKSNNPLPSFQCYYKHGGGKKASCTLYQSLPKNKTVTATLSPKTKPFKRLVRFLFKRSFSSYQTPTSPSHKNFGSRSRCATIIASDGHRTLQIGDYVKCGDRMGKADFSYSDETVMEEFKIFRPAARLMSLPYTGKARICGSAWSLLLFSKATTSVTQRRIDDFAHKTFQHSSRSNQEVTREAWTRTHHDAGSDVHKKKQRFLAPVVFDLSGKVVKISKTQLTLQKTQPVLFYSQAELHVRKSEWVKRGSPILTLTHQSLITGDIVQGIPRIEQLFEAFTSPPTGLKETVLYDTLHSQVRDIFRKNWSLNPLPIAVRQSLEQIQQILVESIQKVYLSQGVLIADKHIEIVVRQMTSKVQILDSGSTGLFLEEVIPLRQIENANITTPGKKALYAPSVVGLSSAALSSDSFISSASFQETTRVLSRDAVVGKSDFLRGLKEKVVIGDLIAAGTGLEIYFIYTRIPTTIL